MTVCKDRIQELSTLKVSFLFSFSLLSLTGHDRSVAKNSARRRERKREKEENRQTRGKKHCRGKGKKKKKLYDHDSLIANCIPSLPHWYNTALEVFKKIYPFFDILETLYRQSCWGLSVPFSSFFLFF